MRITAAATLLFAGLAITAPLPPQSNNAVSSGVAARDTPNLEARQGGGLAKAISKVFTKKPVGPQLPPPNPQGYVHPFHAPSPPPPPLQRQNARFDLFKDPGSP